MWPDTAFLAQRLLSAKFYNFVFQEKLLLAATRRRVAPTQFLSHNIKGNKRRRLNIFSLSLSSARETFLCLAQGQNIICQRRAAGGSEKSALPFGIVCQFSVCSSVPHLSLTRLILFCSVQTKEPSSSSPDRRLLFLP